MRALLPGLALTLLLVSSSPAWSASAGSCIGLSSQLAAISKQLTLGETDAAQRLFTPLLQSHPNCPEIVLAQARASAARGQASEAADLFVQYTDLRPEDSKGLAYFGRFFLDQRDYMRADALSAAAVDKNPNDAAALALRGQILTMKGQSNDGRSMLEKACKLDPNDPEAQFQLGSAYDSLKRPAEAVKHFRIATTLRPGDGRAWDYLGLNLEPLGEVEAADQAYRKGLQVNQPGRYFDAFLDYNYGRFLAKRNDLAASKQYLDHAVEMVPQIRAVWFERSKVNLSLKNYAQARTDAETAERCKTQGGIIDLQIYALLAQVYTRLGERALANKYATLSRETEPPVRKDY